MVKYSPACSTQAVALAFHWLSSALFVILLTQASQNMLSWVQGLCDRMPTLAMNVFVDVSIYMYIMCIYIYQCYSIDSISPLVNET